MAWWRSGVRFPSAPLPAPPSGDGDLDLGEDGGGDRRRTAVDVRVADAGGVAAQVVAGGTGEGVAAGQQQRAPTTRGVGGAGEGVGEVQPAGHPGPRRAREELVGDGGGGGEAVTAHDRRGGTVSRGSGATDGEANGG